MENMREKVMEGLNFRYACKEFNSDKKISDEDFNVILESGRLSPSSLGLEPWKFLVVQNQELRNKMLPICEGAQKQLPTASHFVVLLSRLKKDMIYCSDYTYNTLKHIKDIPDEVINMLTDFYKNFQENNFELLESDRAMFDWASKQSYIPLTNMMTSAALLKIDSCPIEGFNRKKITQLLHDEGVINKDEFNVSCMVAFGYRIEEPREKTRQSLEAIVKWV